jgi:hypothetical protein
MQSLDVKRKTITGRSIEIQIKQKNFELQSILQIFICARKMNR